MRILVLGAGYIGARVGELALADGHEIVLADNWYATERSQLDTLEAAGARVETVDIRQPEGRRARPRRGLRPGAPARRAGEPPVSEHEPDYTEATNATGVRVVAEAVAARGGPAVAFASSLRVYGDELEGEVTADRAYGSQSDLQHLTKVYGELVLGMHAARAGFELALARLGIVYGPSPGEHDGAGSQTVVDRFRRLAAAGEDLPLDDGGRATIGVVHVDDAARILLEAPAGPANVAAETITVADVARLARGEPRRTGRRSPSPRRSRTSTPSTTTCGREARSSPAHAGSSDRGRHAPRGARARRRQGRAARRGRRERGGPRGRGDRRGRPRRPRAPGRLRRRPALRGRPGPGPLPAPTRRGRCARTSGRRSNLLEGCLEHGCGLVYPSTVRAGVEPPPDPTRSPSGSGKRRAACTPPGRRRFGLPRSSARARWRGKAPPERSRPSPRAPSRATPIVISGDPDRVRDFVYVDDIAPALATLVDERRWNETRRARERHRHSAPTRGRARERGRRRRLADRGARRRACPRRELELRGKRSLAQSKVCRPPARGRSAALCRLAPPPSRS